MGNGHHWLIVTDLPIVILFKLDAVDVCGSVGRLRIVYNNYILSYFTQQYNHTTSDTT